VRVLYDHQVFSYQAQGGVSRYFAELILGLERRGHQAAKGWRFTPSRYLPGADLLPSLRFKGKAQLRAFVNAGVSKRALRGEFDLFHPTYYDPYFLPLLHGRPFVLTLHDMTHELYPEGLKDAATLPARKRLLAAQAACLLAVSENTKADAVRLMGLDPARIVVVPHGNSLRPGTVTAQLPRHEKPYWLYVGARHGYKDFAVLVKALGRRGAAGRGESLVLVGGGPVSAAEAELLQAHGLAENCTQTDCSEAELAGWYSQALGLVYPSRYEGFGIPLLEAMAWGCPVVAARASSLPEVGGEAALYFEPGNPEDLAAQLERLDSAGTRQALIAAGRAREALFTWDAAVEKTLAVYQSVLGVTR